MKYIISVCCILFITISAVYPCRAGEIILKTSMISMLEYNDNIYFSKNNVESDFILAALPAIDLSYNRETITMKAGLEGSRYQYMTHSYLSGSYYNVDLGSLYRFSERVLFTTDINLKKEESLRYELSETGIITDFNNRHTTAAGIGYKYIFSENLDFSFNWTSSKIEYDSSTGIDNKRNSVSTVLSKNMSKKDTLFIQQSYSGLKSSVNNVDSVGLHAGWTHLLDETWTISGHLGGRRTETVYYDEFSENVWGIVAGLSLKKSGETWRSGVEVSRDLKYGSYGDPVENDLLSVYIHKDFSQKLRYLFALNAAKSKSSAGERKSNSRYYTFDNSLELRIAENIFLSANYSYALNNDRLRETEPSLSRNIFHINLKYHFKPLFY